MSCSCNCQCKNKDKLPDMVGTFCENLYQKALNNNKIEGDDLEILKRKLVLFKLDMMVFFKLCNFNDSTFSQTDNIKADKVEYKEAVND